MKSIEENFLPGDLRDSCAYFERALFAYNNAAGEGIDPYSKGMLTAFCLHACQSFRESLEQFSTSRTRQDLFDTIQNLPFLGLIQEMRNQDLHGYPIPVCLPGVHSHVLRANPAKPMRLSSSHGVGVNVQLIGMQPKVTLMPKDQKHGKFTLGSAIGFSCIDGVLYVRDYSKQVDLQVLNLLYEFLNESSELLTNIVDTYRTPTPEPQPD